VRKRFPLVRLLTRSTPLKTLFSAFAGSVCPPHRSPPGNRASGGSFPLPPPCPPAETFPPTKDYHQDQPRAALRSSRKAFSISFPSNSWRVPFCDFCCVLHFLPSRTFWRLTACLSMHVQRWSFRHRLASYSPSSIHRAPILFEGSCKAFCEPPPG